MSVTQRRVVVIGGVAALLIGGYVLARGRGKETVRGPDAARADDDASAPGGEITRSTEGLSPPLAASAVGNGSVVVAALEGQNLLVQRIDGSDTIVGSRAVLGDVAASPDADIKVFAQPDGIQVLWRGLRDGTLGRWLVALDPDLKVRATTTVQSSTMCATRTDLWVVEGDRATAHSFSARPTRSVAIPSGEDVSLFCAGIIAYVVLDAEDHTQVMALDGRAKPVTVLRDRDFGEDEQRELFETADGDDIGFVRVASSGALALRDVQGGKPGTLHPLKTVISHDYDLISADSSRRVIVLVYTEDVGDDGGTRACPRVMALRIDRQSLAETTLELSPGRCGYEIGPFFTSAVGEAVSIAWPERTGGLGKPRAPVVSLATTLLPVTGMPKLTRIDQAADAIADATCDANVCYAVALARSTPSAPALAKVVRYNAPSR